MSACVCGYDTVSQMARHRRTCKVLQMAELKRKHNEYVKDLLVENEKLKRLVHADLPEAKAVVDEVVDETNYAHIAGKNKKSCAKKIKSVLSKQNNIVCVRHGTEANEALSGVEQ